jgi:hypothetical protein
VDTKGDEMKALKLLGALALNTMIANPMQRLAISGQDIDEAIIELEELQSRSCLSCVSCNKDMQLTSYPPQYTLSCGVFNTVFVNDFKQSCSRYEAKDNK